MLGRTQRLYFSSFPPKRLDWTFTTDKFLGDWGKGGSNFQETAVAEVTAGARETEPMPDNSPAPVKPKQEEKTNYEELLDKVYQLESSSGQNDICENYGEGHNGYGFGIYNNRLNCYNSDADCREEVDKWFRKEISENGLSVAEALCKYNTGSPAQNCEYLEKFNQLNYDKSR